MNYSPVNKITYLNYFGNHFEYGYTQIGILGKLYLDIKSAPDQNWNQTTMNNFSVEL